MLYRTPLAFLASALTSVALAAPSSNLYEVEPTFTAQGGETLHSVAVDRQGNTWLADGEHTVYVQEAEGPLRVFATGAATDMDTVRIAPDGTIVVSGLPMTGWHPDGTQLWSVTCGFDDPQGMDIGPDGTVYMANRHEICAVDPDSATASFVGTYDRVVQGLAVDHETGDLFALFGASASARDRSVERLDPVTGVSVEVMGPPGKAFTHTGMADFGQQGVLVADRASNAVLLLDEGGGSIELASGFQELGDVSVGADGQLYVTDLGARAVYRIDRDPDADGVDSLADACVDSAPGERVSAEGCTGMQVVEYACGADRALTDRQELATCVANVTNEVVKAGLLSPQAVVSIQGDEGRTARRGR